MSDPFLERAEVLRVLQEEFAGPYCRRSQPARMAIDRVAHWLGLPLADAAPGTLEPDDDGLHAAYELGRQAGRAERADADRRVAEERATLLKFLRGVPVWRAVQELADAIERGEHLRDRGTP